MKTNYVISGIGQISGMGTSIEELTERLQQGVVGFRVNNEYRTYLGEVNDFDYYQQGFNTKIYMDRASQFTSFAVRQVLEDIGTINYPPERLGLITCSQFGCYNSAVRYLNELKTLRKPRLASPLYFVNSLCNSINCISTIECNIRGFSNHLIGGNEGGLFALWQGVQALRNDMADYMIVGGVEALSAELITQLQNYGFMARLDKHSELRGPFDRDRRYPVWSEGAGFIGIEREATATSFGRKIYARIKGIGIANVSTRYKEEAIIQSMQKAMNDGQVDQSQISFIMANGNGTRALDYREGKAIFQVFGNSVPVFANKSYFGETISAAGVLALISAVLFPQKVLPLNKNLVKPDSKLDIRTKYKDVKVKKGDYCLVNGFNNEGTSITICLEL